MVTYEPDVRDRSVIGQRRTNRDRSRMACQRIVQNEANHDFRVAGLFSQRFACHLVPNDSLRRDKLFQLAGQGLAIGADLPLRFEERAQAFLKRLCLTGDLLIKFVGKQIGKCGNVLNADFDLNANVTFLDKTSAIVDAVMARVTTIASAYVQLATTKQRTSVITAPMQRALTMTFSSIIGIALAASCIGSFRTHCYPGSRFSFAILRPGTCAEVGANGGVPARSDPPS